MSKIAIVFWSGTGNTAQMAQAISEGASVAGAETTLINASRFKAEDMDAFDSFAFGCPAMGAEVLEESEFEPMFSDVETALSGKRIALFGSYGWGDGQWMRDWVDRCKASGINLINEGLIANESPNDADVANCKALGASLN